MARHLVSRPAAALTAVLVAAYPLFIFYAGYFSSETPSLALLAVALWLGYGAQKPQGPRATLLAAGAGATGVAALAIRPQFALNLAIVGLPLLWRWRADWRPAAALVGSGLALLTGVIAYNSAAAGQLTGLSENAGLTFYQDHCDVHLVEVGSVAAGNEFLVGNPVAKQRKRGRDYSFQDHAPWDQSFFYREGLRCVSRDGIGHLGRLGQNLLDTTAVATPWPLSEQRTVGAVARVVNLAYSILLPLIAIGALLLILERRRSGLRVDGERDLLLHLACLVPVALVFSAEPRYRVPYDLFGLTLLAVLIVEGVRRGRPRRPA
jgi:4-amino-4-deoxy-L-arabinose transferase-like glycosyltransferase